jgi:hypothetical protein
VSTQQQNMHKHSKLKETHKMHSLVNRMKKKTIKEYKKLNRERRRVIKQHLRLKIKKSMLIDNNQYLRSENELLRNKRDTIDYFSYVPTDIIKEILTFADMLDDYNLRTLSKKFNNVITTNIKNIASQIVKKDIKDKNFAVAHHIIKLQERLICDENEIGKSFEFELFGLKGICNALSYIDIGDLAGEIWNLLYEFPSKFITMNIKSINLKTIQIEISLPEISKRDNGSYSMLQIISIPRNVTYNSNWKLWGLLWILNNLMNIWRKDPSLTTSFDTLMKTFDSLKELEQKNEIPQAFLLHDLITNLLQSIYYQARSHISMKCISYHTEIPDRNGLYKSGWKSIEDDLTKLNFPLFSMRDAVNKYTKLRDMDNNDDSNDSSDSNDSNDGNDIIIESGNEDIGYANKILDEIQDIMIDTKMVKFSDHCNITLYTNNSFDTPNCLQILFENEHILKKIHELLD